MNIETIFNNAEDKEICKYALYTKTQDGYINAVYDLYVDKACTKALTYELVAPEDDTDKVAFLEKLDKMLTKGVIVKGVDEDGKVIHNAPVFDWSMNRATLCLKILTVAQGSNSNTVLTMIPYTVTIR